MDGTKIRFDPTNAVIVTKADGKIVRNGIHHLCPHCGAEHLHNYGTVPICNVGAIGRWECRTCRKRYNTLSLPVPVDITPEEFYEKIRKALFEEDNHGKQ